MGRGVRNAASGNIALGNSAANVASVAHAGVFLPARLNYGVSLPFVALVQSELR